MGKTQVRRRFSRQRLRSSLTANDLDAFRRWLKDRGYRPRTISATLWGIAGWMDWLQETAFSTGDLEAAFAAWKKYLKTRPHGRSRYGSNSRSVRAACLFLTCLRHVGRLAPAPVAISIGDRWPLLGEFRSWMQRHRGIADSTLDGYQGVLTGLVETLGEDPREYTGARLRAFVHDRARSHSAWRAKSIVVAVRALIRFLGATGRCEPGLEHAIPGFACRDVFSIPRFLHAADVERVIASCGAGACGVRDHAIVLLLARLGLRAGEVARLRFHDIDWKHGRVAVCGKGRHEEWLPLPQGVGAAVLRYVQEARPAVHVPEVFTTSAAPWRALSRQAVTTIARGALARAGVKGATSGAHILRHSVATTMLRQGASLRSISAGLRHRSLRTTTHYAKVDFGLLVEIAQPWPTRVPC